MNDGIYTDLTIEDYHRNSTHISATQIKIAKRSLKEWDWFRRGLIPQDRKMHLDFGNAFELALVNPIEFSEKVAIIKDAEWIAEALKEKPDLQKPRSSKKYSDLAKEFYESQMGKAAYFVNDKGNESYETITHMMASCYADSAIQSLIVNTEYQLSLFWTDETTCLRLKTRPDICRRKKNVVVNIKTIEAGDPSSFSKDLAKYDYPLQACVEMTGCIESGIMPEVDKYFWLVVEKQPPYCATIYEFDLSDRLACMDELGYLFNKISRAMKEDKYPGYSDRSDNEYGILKANIPMWYKILS